MRIDSFKDLIVWQRSIELVKEIYKITNKLPSVEQYGLLSQMRRCAISIPSNIAEGHKRGTKKDFIHFLRISDGSGSELETQLVILSDIYKDIDTTRSKELLLEVQKMLGAIIKKLNN